MAEANHRYHISPLRNAFKTYALRESGEILGTLSLHGVHNATAKAKIGAAEMDIARTSALRKSLMLWRQSDSEALCFSADLLSQGRIETGGKEFCWKPINLRWTVWAWQDAHGRNLMEVSVRHSFRGIRGNVRSVKPLEETWQKELALLGWYLALLNETSFGTHILSAVRLAAHRA